MKSKVAIGIDFGTSKCCVAAVRNGEVEVIPNARGQKTTPSCVAFDQSRCLVGGEAEDQAIVNPTNFIYGIKKILGRFYKDPLVQKYTKHSPVNVIDVNGRPALRVDYRGETLDLSPEIITAMLLRRVKEEAELHLGEIGGVVVSVPAYFGSGQRQAIVTASELAGLELLDLICEPTATALTYSENKKISEAHEILVVDIGAGKLDVSMIRVSDDEIRVLAVCGDDSFGGDDLDLMLMEDVLGKEFPKNSLNPLTPKQVISMGNACEKTKKTLTLLNDSNVIVDNFVENKEIKYFVSRKKFEDSLSKRMLSKFKKVLDQVLKDSGVPGYKVAEVLVVGGTSRIHKIQQMVGAHFNNKTLNKTVNVDEAVAQGAAIQAHRLSNGMNQPRALELVRDPSKNDIQPNSFKTFREYKPGVAVEIRAPGKGNAHKSFGFKKFKLGDFGIFQNDSYHLPQQLAIQVGITPALPKKGYGLATELLERFNTDILSYKKGVETQNNLEEFCYSFKEKLDNLLESTNDILAWTCDGEGVSEDEAEQKKQQLFEEYRMLLHAEDAWKKPSQNSESGALLEMVVNDVRSYSDERQISVSDCKVANSNGLTVRSDGGQAASDNIEDQTSSCQVSTHDKDTAEAVSDEPMLVASTAAVRDEILNEGSKSRSAASTANNSKAEASSEGSGERGSSTSSVAVGNEDLISGKASTLHAKCETTNAVNEDTKSKSGSTQSGIGSPQSGNGSTQSGSGSTQSGSGSTQSGSGSTQSGSGSTQSGSGSTQSGSGSTQSGSGNTQSGSGSTQSGSGSAQTGSGSAQTGSGSTQSGSGSAQSGNGSIQSGNGSTQSGSGSTQSGNGSTNTGSGSTNTGSGSTQSGSGSAQSGSGSTQSGNGSTRSGSGSAQSGNGSTHSESRSTLSGSGSSQSENGSTQSGNGSTQSRSKTTKTAYEVPRAENNITTAENSISNPGSRATSPMSESTSRHGAWVSDKEVRGRINTVRSLLQNCCAYDLRCRCKGSTNLVQNMGWLLSNFPYYTNLFIQKEVLSLLIHYFYHICEYDWYHYGQHSNHHATKHW